MTFTEALAKGKAGELVSVAVVSNREDGEVAYITGNLIYIPGSGIVARLSSPSVAPGYILNTKLSMLLSDKGETVNGKFQPFYYGKTASVPVFNIALNADGSIDAMINNMLNNKDNLFYVSLQDNGGFLYGVGTSVDNNSLQAIYTISFPGPVHLAHPTN